MLANFLGRAASLAGRQGADLRVVGIRAGSLSVLIKAVRKNAAKEFREKPIDTTLKASAVVVAIVAACLNAMAPARGSVSPLAKAAAELVDRREVTQITIVTGEGETVLMNAEISRNVREARVNRDQPSDQQQAITEHISQHVVALEAKARRGDLSGEVLLVGQSIHFRPDGYKFLVPVDTIANDSAGELTPFRRYKVTGHIRTRDGQPDLLIVSFAMPL